MIYIYAEQLILRLIIFRVKGQNMVDARCLSAVIQDSQCFRKQLEPFSKLRANYYV